MYTDKTLTLRKSMYMRASGASELRKFSRIFTYKTAISFNILLVLQILVGTNDMLVGLHEAANFEMYRQNSEKALWGGGGDLPPCPPPSPRLR